MNAHSIPCDLDLEKSNPSLLQATPAPNNINKTWNVVDLDKNCIPLEKKNFSFFFFYFEKQNKDKKQDAQLRSEPTAIAPQAYNCRASPLQAKKCKKITGPWLYHFQIQVCLLVQWNCVTTQGERPLTQGDTILYPSEQGPKPIHQSPFIFSPIHCEPDPLSLPQGLTQPWTRWL